MALSCKVGSFSLNTATGNQAITSLGFQPEVIIFYSVIVTGDGLSTGGAAYKLYFGGAVSSSSRFSIGNVCNDNVSSGSHHSRHDNTKCLTSLTNAGAVFTAADFVSMDADGFTINVTTANASSRVWHYIALGGTDLTNVAIKEFQNPGATGNQATTGVGFQGDCFLFFGINSDSAPPAQATTPQLFFGMATPSNGQAAFGGYVGAVTDAVSVFRTDLCYATVDSSNVLQDEASFVSADSDGFTLNWAVADTANAYIWAICLKGGSYKIGTFTSSASTGDQTVTSVGFSPTGVILFANGAGSEGVQSGHSRISFGAASSASARAAIWSGKTDNTSPTVCDNSEQADKLVTLATEGTPTVIAEADLTSLDSDGFTPNWSTAVSRTIAYLAVGNTPSAATALLPVMMNSNQFNGGMAL